jgi:IS30 family transposase
VPDAEQMTVNERRKCLKRMQGRYLSGTREERSRLLDELVVLTGLHRKSVVRLLKGPSLERQPRRRQRSREYGAAVDDALRVIWESLDYVCAERLTPVLVTTAEQLARHGELAVTAEVLEQLGRISISSVQRRLTRLGQDTMRLPRRGPDRANKVATAIPMRRIPWDTADPGHFEIDLVHHSGPSSSGEFVHTFQMIDVATGWSERVAILGRGQAAMERGTRQILARLPFQVKELHPDNGPEFLNHHLVRIWGEEITGLTLTRSRPYQKNDNRFVEQKNDTLVRAYLGQARLDTAEQCAALNVLYDQMWVYYNLFQPVLHLVEKTHDGVRTRRRWDDATTPFARLLATNTLDPTARERLERLYAETNPRALRRTIQAGLHALLYPRPSVLAPTTPSDDALAMAQAAS